MRKTATLCYMYICHSVLHVKLPSCVTRKTATLRYT